MAFAKRSAAYSNGLDKKYDDNGTGPQSWRPNTDTRMRPWNGIRKRRIVLAVVVLGLLYLFVKNMPTDVVPAGNRIDPLTGLNRARMPSLGRPNRQSSSLNTARDGEIYDGPVRFPVLASTLHGHAHKTKDGRENAVFILHDLKSAAPLTTVACELALHNRTTVHMLLACPQESTVDEIVDLAGIAQQECPIYWHDGRVDHNSQSSFARRATAIHGAMGHVHSYLRPVVVVIDQQQARHSQLTAALKLRLDQTWTPLVILPDNALTSMSWVTTLDAKGLSLLSQNQIDVLITPYRSSAGSLLRLLQSIQSAEYSGLPLPRITVEIPPDIDAFALRYLEFFRWPSEVPTTPSKLILRKRLRKNGSSPSTSVIQTLESFYPPSYPMSHVLLLDPDVELSPDYLSYLHYLTMEYKYSSRGENVTHLLAGISLDISTPKPGEDFSGTPFVLSQNPTSAATLYFGDKWVELQNYLSLRLREDPDLKQIISQSSNMRSSPVREQSAFLTIASELMRAQNYYVLHPTFSAAADTRLITKHTESHQSAEHFKLPTPEMSHSDLHIPPPTLDKTTILSNEDTYPPLRPSKHHPQPDLTPGYLSSLLKDAGYAGLPPDRSIPTLDHSGQRVTWMDSIVASKQYADKVSLQLGGCTNLNDRDETKLGVERLFCTSSAA